MTEGDRKDRLGTVECQLPAVHYLSDAFHLLAVALCVL